MGFFHSRLVIIGKAQVLWNSTMTDFINYTCAFAAVTCQTCPLLLWRKGTNSLPLIITKSSFQFLHFSLFSKHFFGVMFHSGFCLILHNLNFHALFILHMQLFHLTTHCVFLICCLSAVDWPKEGHVKSWVDIADIRSDSTTRAWDETYDFHLLCTYTVCIQMTSLILFLLSYVHVLLRNYSVTKMTHQMMLQNHPNIHVYWVDQST